MTDKPDLTADDEALLAVVGEVLDATEPLSDELVDALAGEAFSLGNLDAIMAELAHDSLTMAGDTRSVGDFRTLDFAGGGVEIEVRFTEDNDVHGRIDPRPARCAMQLAGDEQLLSLDEYGRFATKTESRRVRFIAWLDDDRPVMTPWIFR